MESRKRYLLAGKKSTGVLQIDNGAVQAILQGSSLLPVGVKEVKGKFERGDTVRVTALSGKDIALGLVNYSAKDLLAFHGRQSAEIEPLLGYTFGDEVIHRNNMLLL
jgi:glutamate 5-kinase